MYFLWKMRNSWKNSVIQNKVCNSMKEEFQNEPIYNKIFLKTKIKSYGDESTDFHDNKSF